MKQTAVELLKEKLTSVFINDEGFNNLFIQAKEMEKQQIEDAHIEGQRVFDKHPHTQWTNDQAEQYYNETYGSKGSDDHIVDTNEMVSSQTEISDEEIEKFAEEFANDYAKVGVTENEVSAFFTGMKKYREQLKQRQ